MAAKKMCTGSELCLFMVTFSLICINCTYSTSIRYNKDEVSREISYALKSGSWSTVYDILSSSNFYNKYNDCLEVDFLNDFLKESVVLKSLATKFTLCDSKDSGNIRKVPPASHQEVNNNTRRVRKRQVYIIKTPPFISIEDGNTMIQDGFPLVTRTLNLNPQIFHSGTVNANFISILQDVYSYIAANWKPVNTKICHDFQSYINTFCETSNTKDEFFQKVIAAYSDETLFGVNKALIRQGIIYTYTPTSEEMMVGAYALTLDVVLMYWDNLVKVTDTTYYGVDISESEDVAKYQIGTTFTWLSFTSALIVERESLQLKNTLFVIDNTLESPWQPRNVRGIQGVKDDIDVMYPVGTQFRITDRTSSPIQTRIYIELINKASGHRMHILSIIMPICLQIVLIYPGRGFI